MRTEVLDGRTWLIDNNGNRASIERWGSEEKAIAALNSCSDCSHCSDCYRCSDCYCCSRCSDCSGCSHCSDCYRCSDCSDCYRCSDCSGCSDCSDCSDCYRCSRCSRCSDCSGKEEKLDIPIIKDIHRKIYEAASAKGCLDMSTWHRCETTHCRAGWVTTIAGEAGKKLEQQTSCLFAAMQIYKASGYEISPVRFYDSNDDALADMKRLAEEEANINA